MKKMLFLIIGSFGVAILTFILISGHYNNSLFRIQKQLQITDSVAVETEKHFKKLDYFYYNQRLYDSLASIYTLFNFDNTRQIKRIIQLNKHINLTSQKQQHRINNCLSSLIPIESKLYFVLAKTGFKEEGHIGKMRSIIHTIEQNYPEFEERTLSLRRHEKDFIMRHDSIYVNLLHFEAKLWKKSKNTPIELHEYLRQFDQVVYYSKFLDTKSNQNIYNQINLIREILLFTIQQSRSDLIQRSILIATHSKTTYFIFSIFLFASLIIGSYVISRKIANQLTKLNRSMSDFIDSNYKTGDNFSRNLPKNEIGQIMGQYMKMARKIKTDVMLLEDRVSRRTKALSENNLLLENQQNEIQESLRYGQKIQESLMTPPNCIKSIFQSFSYCYIPKNIVSGDFFWIKEFQNEQGKYVLFALADATGHGIPAALLSVLCLNLLEETYNKGHKSPHTLLNQVRKKLMQRFHSEEQRFEGMDIALFRYNLTKNTLEFTGAQMPIWILRENAIIEVPYDRFPVGFSYLKQSSFHKNIYSMLPNDKVILFTDGLIDQFGGINNKKYSKQRLRKFLLKHADQTPSKLVQKLKHEFETWKGTLEQTDDCSFVIIEPYQLQNASYSETKSSKYLNENALSII